MFSSTDVIMKQKLLMYARVKLIISDIKTGLAIRKVHVCFAILGTQNQVYFSDDGVVIQT